MPTQPQTIGKPERRKDLLPKVTGFTRYTSDIAGPDAWTGLVLRSPHHHARLLGIDTARARCLPGVQAILTGADIPGSKTFGALVPDQPALAVGTVRHLGEPVALIVAATPEIARQAADLVAVGYEILPAVFDPCAALEPGAPQVHPDGNLLSHFRLEAGDLEAGFAGSEVTLTATFEVPRAAPAYIEAETAAAVYQPDGTLTVWVSSQQPFEDQRHIAAVLGIPAGRVQVRAAAVGGAFGGKEDSEIAILAALGAWASRGAVRIANTRSESFLAHPKRHPARLAYRVGAGRDGSLLALEALATLDTGAYASLGPAVGSLLTELLCGPYRVPNARVETRVAYTNSPPSGAVRGFGSPQAHFAIESLMDMLADRLGIDPLEIRRRNMLRPGDRLITGAPVNDTALSLPQILAAAQEARSRLEQIPPSGGRTAGTGFALAMQSMGLGAKVPDDSTQRLAWMPDGSIRVFLGAPDVGQGLAAAAEQITAEALGMPYARVQAVDIDTRVSPDGGVTCASRMTYLVGNSLLLAAEQLKRTLLAASAPLFGVPVEQLSYEAGTVLLRKEGGELRVPVAELTGRLAESNITLEAQATFSFPYPPETTPMHLPAGMPHVLFGFGGQVIRVEVDPETGMTEVTHVVAIHDAGRVINRQGVEGQIHGGTLMAIGYALFENMQLKPDNRWVDSFAEYLLPTSADLPASFETIILEIPEASGPFGAKGIGEITTALAAPAIANAIARACGRRVVSLPIHPQAIAQPGP